MLTWHVQGHLLPPVLRGRGGPGPGHGAGRGQAARPPTVSAEDLLSVNRGKKKKLVTELIVRLATPGVDTVVFSSLLRFLSTGEYPSQVRCAAVFV